MVPARVTEHSEVDGHMARIQPADLPDDLPVRNNIVRLTYRNPEMHRGFASLSGRVHSTSHLSNRLRELIVLTVLARLRAGYEWQQHTVAALRSGVTSDEVTAIAQGDTSSFDAAEQAAMALATAVDAVAVSGPLWDEARRHYGEVELLDLVMLAGFYGCAARVVLALDVDLEEPAEA
jgi:4-carboxymuconolactone decarboxylase